MYGVSGGPADVGEEGYGGHRLYGAPRPKRRPAPVPGHRIAPSSLAHAGRGSAAASRTAS